MMRLATYICLVFACWLSPSNLSAQCAGCASGKGCKKPMGLAACPSQKAPIDAYKPKRISSSSLSGNPSQFPPEVATPPAGFPKELSSPKEAFGGSNYSTGGANMSDVALEPGEIYQMQLSQGKAAHVEVNLALEEGTTLRFRQTQGSFEAPTWTNWTTNADGEFAFGRYRSTTSDSSSPWYGARSALDYVQFQIVELDHPGRREPGAGAGIDIHPPELGYHVSVSGSPPLESAAAALLHPTISFDAGIGANASDVFCGKLEFRLALDTPTPTRSDVKLVDYRSIPGASTWSPDINVTPPAMGSSISEVTTATARAVLSDVEVDGTTVGFKIQFFTPPTSSTVAREWLVEKKTVDGMPGVSVKETSGSVLLASRSVHYSGTEDGYTYLDIDHLEGTYSEDTVAVSLGADLSNPASVHLRTVTKSSGFINAADERVLDHEEEVKYQLMPWGREEVVERTMDPTGAALKTTYSYYDQYPVGALPSPYNPVNPIHYRHYQDLRRYGKLKGVVHPDGKWERHDHMEGKSHLGVYGVFNASEYTSVEMIESPWGDTAFDPHGQLDSPSDLLTEKRLNSTEFYNVEARIESHLHHGFTLKDEESSISNTLSRSDILRAHTTGIGNPTIINRSFRSDVIDSNLFEPSSEYAYNTLRLWSSRRGNLTFNTSTKDYTFAAAANGMCKEATELTQTRGDSLYQQKTITLVDARRREVSKETWRPSGRTPLNQNSSESMTWISVGKETTVYDSSDRITLRYVNGRLEYSASYPDDFTTVETDANGVVVTTTRLGGGRIVSEVRAALPAAGALPVVPLMTTSYSYTNGRFDPTDASPVFAAVGANHTALKVTKTITSSSSTRSTYEIFDLTGRMVCSCDEQGRVYLYRVESTLGSGRRETRIGPGGVQEVSEYFLDGRLKRSFTQLGTDVFAERSWSYKHVYQDEGGVWRNVDDVDLTTSPGRYLPASNLACIQTTEFIGPPALGRWRSAIVDGAGVTLKQAEPVRNGGAFQEKSREFIGHSTQKRGTYGNPTRLTRTGFAPHEYIYNNSGDAIRQGSELSGDASTAAGFLSGAVASPDRVTLTARWWEADSSGTWMVEEESRGFLPDLAGSANGTEVKSLRKTLLKPASSSVISDSILQRADGTSLRSTVTYDAVSQTTTETTSSNQTGVSQTGVSLSRMGRVYQRRELHGDTASTVTYAYHPMGELMSMTTSTGLELLYQEYNPSGQLSLKRSPADGQTTYSYYPADHVSAGLLEDETNAQGNTRSYTYDSIGRVLTLRGTAAQPLDYAYNSLGEMERLTTYRTEDTATAAHTDWYYDPVSGALRAKVPDAPATRLIPDYTEEFCLSSSPPGTVQYAYDSDGRLLKKLNARGQVIAYTHAPNTGDLTNVDYEAASATADVTFTNHDRLGRARTITDGSGTRILLYQADSKNPAEVNYTAGALAGLKYSAPLGTTGLPSGVELHRGLTKDYDADYSYDTQGRLERVTLAGLASASYNYDPVTNRVRDLRHYDLTAGDDPVGQPEGYNIAHTSIPIPGAMQSSTSSVGKPSVGDTVPLSGVAYQHDNLGRRSKATLADGSWHEYSYNRRGEVQRAARLWPAPPQATPAASPVTLVTPSSPVVSPLVPVLGPIVLARPYVPPFRGGISYTYGYDSAGNRRSENRRLLRPDRWLYIQVPTWTAIYDSQNQATRVATTQSIELHGQSSDPVPITINYNFADTQGTMQAVVSRHADLFSTGIFVPRRGIMGPLQFPWETGISNSPRWVRFAISQGTQNQSGSAYVPTASEPPFWINPLSSEWAQNSWTLIEEHIMREAANDYPEYDKDGNLSHTSRWDYAWDDENRLLYMQTTLDGAGAGVPAVRVSFTYDYMGRRVSKSVQSVTFGPDFNAVLGGPSYTLGTAVVERYVYDKWNLIMTYNDTGGTLTPSHSYVWGLDLAGQHGGGMSRSQAAGGVGGLLFDCFGPTTSTSTACYIPSADGNGNILSYALLSDPSAPAASYTYEPFGKVESQTINLPAVASQFRFGFSSKFTDSETGMVYYGHRYYSPELGRFLSRDPIEERGGINLYGFVGNDPVNRWDYLGLDAKKKDKCVSIIRAGHTHQIGSQKFPKPLSKCDRFTGVGCFAGTVNKQNQGSVPYEGEGFDDPDIDNYKIYNDRNDSANDSDEEQPNTMEPGFLWPEKAYQALKNAVEAAKYQATKDCADPNNCCKSITIKVECPRTVDTRDGRSLDFYDLTPKGESTLCGRTFEFKNCGKK